MQQLNRHPADSLFVVAYSAINAHERKYLQDRNHHANANECASVIYVFGRPIAIVGLTSDPPYICEVCHSTASEVHKCSTVDGTYWGHERCVVQMAKKLFDGNMKSDAQYFGELLDESEPLATYEDKHSLSKPRDFLFVAHLHGASMRKNMNCVLLTFRDGSAHSQPIDQSYWIRCSKVYG